MIPLPTRLPYPDAATIADALSASLAECRDPEAAAAIVRIVNAAWGLAMAEGSSVFGWRRALEELYAAVKAASEEGE
jgi:hypothetical protein